MKLHNSPHKFAPKSCDMFRMMYMIHPKDIKVVMVGQSPYADGEACGIPFMTKSGRITKTLRNISKELSRQYKYSTSSEKSINEIVEHWVDEGVFTLNMSFSIGIPPSNMPRHEQYTLNHDVLWEEFVRNLVRYIANTKKRIPIILLGAVAWKLEDELMSSFHVIKAPFPTRDEFVGSGVFGKCDELADISWV